MFLKRNPNHYCAILNPRTWTPSLPKLCLVKWRKSMRGHLAPKITPHLPQTRIITEEITEECILVFSLQLFCLVGIFSGQSRLALAWLRNCSSKAAPQESQVFKGKICPTAIKTISQQIPEQSPQMPLFDFGYRNPSWSEQNGWTRLTGSSGIPRLGTEETFQEKKKKNKTFQLVTGLKQICFTTMFQSKSTKSLVFEQLSCLLFFIIWIMMDLLPVTSSVAVSLRSYNKIQLHIPYIISWNCEGAIFIFFKCTRARVTFLLRLSCSIKNPT